MKKVFALPLLFSAVTTSLITALPAPSLSQTVTVPFIIGNLGIQGNNLGSCGVGCVFQPTTLTSASILTPLGQVNISAFNSGSISSTTKDNGTSLFNVNSSSITFTSSNSSNPQPNFLNQLVVNTDGNSASTLVFTGNTSGTASFTPTGTFNNASTTINAVFNTSLIGNNAIQVSIPILSGSIVLPIPSTSVPIQNTIVPFISGTLGILGNNLGGCGGGCIFQPVSLTGASILTPLGLVSIGNFNSGSISSTTSFNGTSVFSVKSSSVQFVVGDQQNFLNQLVVDAGNSASALVFTGKTSGVASFTPDGAFNNATTTINATFNTSFPSGGLTQVSIPIASGSIVLPIALPPAPKLQQPPINPSTQNSPITPPPTQNLPVEPIAQNPSITFSVLPVSVNTELLLALRSTTEVNSDDLQRSREDFSTSPFSSGRFLAIEDK